MELRKYLYALLVVILALCARLILMPITGPGAPFILFSAAVLISSFFWGVGPGILAGAISTPLAAVLFVYQAHYSPLQALAQILVFAAEISVICYLADRFARARERAESSEHAAQLALEERQRTQEALRRSESELREAQRVAKVGNWTWYLKSDDIEWSAELYRIFSKSPDHPPAGYEQLLKLFTSASARKLDEAVVRALENGSSYQLELELANHNDVHRWISARGEPIRSLSGEIIGIRGTAQDITEVKELQRMREEWTSVIAHDLRQPISLISMSAELLPSLHTGEMNGSERVVEERIHSAAMNLSRMVDDLMDISRMEAARLILERKWIDPKLVVRETLTRMSPLTSGFTISLDEDGELLPVYADRMRVEQIVSNLISNAVKYGKNGSNIFVRLQGLPDELQISVTNEGAGISKEEIPTIFSRFWRSKTTRGSGVPGLGLGLYIAKGLVEGHGGRIWVESTPGKTTTFSFTLPTRAEAERKSA